MFNRLQLSFFCTGAGAYMINLIFAGQYVHSKTMAADAILAGVSLAVTFVSITWLSVIIGMSAAVETLCSQHNGAKHYRDVGLVLLKACMIMVVIGVPVLFSWFYAYDIFHAMGIAKDVCTVVQSFVSIRTLGMPADIIVSVFSRYIMAVGIPQVRMWSYAVFCGVVLLSDLFFIVHLKYDYHFLSVSMVLGMYACAFAILGFAWCCEEFRRTVLPLRDVQLSELFSGWWEFIALGIPGTIMLCSEWWAFEFLALMAARLGTADLAAETLVAQLASIAFRLPIALSTSAGSLVGNMIGAKMVQCAKQIGRIAVCITGLLMLFISAMMVLYGDQFVRLFSNEENVVRISLSAIPALAVLMFMDALQTVAGGILRGVGRQELGAYTNLVACYCFGLPLAYVFCFPLKFGVAGLIMGMSSGSFTQATSLLTLVLCFESSMYRPKIETKSENGIALVPYAEKASSLRGRVDLSGDGRCGGYEELATEESERGGSQREGDGD